MDRKIGIEEIKTAFDCKGDRKGFKEKIAMDIRIGI